MRISFILGVNFLSCVIGPLWHLKPFNGTLGLSWHYNLLWYLKTFYDFMPIQNCLAFYNFYGIYPSSTNEVHKVFLQAKIHKLREFKRLVKAILLKNKILDEKR